MIGSASTEPISINFLLNEFLGKASPILIATKTMKNTYGLNSAVNPFLHLQINQFLKHHIIKVIGAYSHVLNIKNIQNCKT